VLDFGGIYMNRLILLFFAKGSVLCFHVSVFIRTTEFSLSAFLIVILYGMNIVFEISDFRRGVDEIFAIAVCCTASVGCYRPISTFGLLRM
jgi:ABC-type polysaccharide/polyol phosphate export permease